MASEAVDAAAVPLALLATGVGYAAVGALGAALAIRAGLLVAPEAEPRGRALAGALAGAAFVSVFGQEVVGAESLLDTAYAALLGIAVGWASFQVGRAGLGFLPWLCRASPWAVVPALAAAGSLAALAGTARGTAPPAAARPSPSVLVVTVDTLRADRVGAYGYASARTPAFDALAAQGVLFEQAIAPSIVTGPSHASIFTGQHPTTHGVTENVELLPEALLAAPEVFRRNGFQTAAFVGGAPVTQASLGLVGRFDVHDDDLRTLRVLPELAYRTALGQLARRALEWAGHDFERYGRPADEVTRAAVDWLRGEERSPFFAWVHYYDPHLPYEPPARLRSEEAQRYRGVADGDWYRADHTRREEIIASPEALAQMSRLYDAEVAFADEQLAALLREARARSGPEGLWVVVTSDHGESFGEHGIFFWRDLYDDTLRVPLVIVPPQPLAEPARVSAQVGLVDLAPTLYAALGLRGVPRTDGRPVALPGRPAPGADGEPEISLIAPSRPHPYSRWQFSIREDGWKAIWRAPGWVPRRDNRRTGESRELYDLEHDPQELRNLAAQRPDVFARLREQLRVAEEADPGPTPLRERDLEMLRALGYAN